jgi:putative SOS response-associated peptidase YedK
MCGRFALNATAEEIEALFSVTRIEPFPPRFNIAPTQPVLAVVNGPALPPGSNRSRRMGMLVRWGLIPAWAKDSRDMPLLFNARSETAAEKHAFKAAMRHRRALVPASGFYEWRRDGRGKKVQAYWVRPKGGGLVAFAGLVETWLEPGGSEIDTGAILTTTVNADLAAIHERMPVVIRHADFERWLDCVRHEPRDLWDLLRPADPGFFEAVPVSDQVNKVTNTGPGIQERVPASNADEHSAENDRSPSGPAQLSLF